MRLGWLLLVVLGPQLAVADPAVDPSKGARPTITIRPVEPSVVPGPAAERLPGATMGTAIIIEPPANFADARDYPLGMVIKPPAAYDADFVISPGALAESVRGFGRRLQDTLGELGKLFEQH